MATIALVMFPIANFDRVKADIDGEFMASIDTVPEISEALRAGERVEHYYGTGDIDNFSGNPTEMDGPWSAMPDIIKILAQPRGSRMRSSPRNGSRMQSTRGFQVGGH